MNKQDKLIKNNYSKYWETAREKIYGFMDYDKNFLELIYKYSEINDKILDVTCGTGDPFIQELIKKGYKNIYGSDIAYNLLFKSKRNFSQAKYIQSNIQNFGFKNNSFDLVFCVHSSWYFSDFDAALKNMLNISKKTVIIDLFNYNNKNKKKTYYWHKFYGSKIHRFIDNLRHFYHKRYDRIVWNFSVEWRAANVKNIIEFLENQTIEFEFMTTDFKKIEDINKLNLYERIILIIKK